MTNEFGKSGEPGDKESFSSDGTEDDTGSQGDSNEITPEDLKELRKRDVNAQAHIPQLQGENSTLREQLAEMQTRLDGSTTLEDVLNRIENKSGDGNNAVSADEVATQVEARLQSKATAQTQDSNWNTVWGKLEERHGSKENIDKYVDTQSASLGMTTDEATLLAKNSPEAFMKLFSAEGSAAPQQGTASAASQQTSHIADTSGAHDLDYYNKMLRENSRKYWKPETQMQLRRDVYGET